MNPAGLTLLETSAFLGVDVATVCRWERRLVAPRGPALRVYTALLDRFAAGGSDAARGP
jgi:DNA-binding transcriptional regulator YiaG